MTKREITHLCFKLLGAYALLLAVADTRGFAYVLTMSPGGSDDMGSHLVAAFGPLILLTLAGLILWTKADFFAGRVFLPETGGPGQAVLSAQEWQVIAFRVLGMFVLVDAIPSMVRVLVFFLVEGENSAMIRRLTTDRIVELVRFAVQMGVGLWLLLSREGLQKLMAKTQRKEAVQEDATETHM